MSRIEAPAGADALVRELLRRGFGDAEVYQKRGRSRSFERALDRESIASAHEAGWAARAGDARRSLFLAATGAPDPATALAAPIDPSPHPLLLPEPGSVPPSEVPAEAAEETATPLATESEAAALLDGVARRLSTELDGARLLRARLDDGASEWSLVSSRGVSADGRARAAWLRLEAERRGRRVELAAVASAARGFRPDALARRLADRLAALDAPASAPEGGLPRALVLAAPLAARLVEALAPLFVGRAGGALLPRQPSDRGEIVASAAMSLIDDGALAGGLLASASDGEGMACRRVVLVEKGRFRTPLLAWWEAVGTREAIGAIGAIGAAGCARRASYRDRPRRAPTHFYLEPGEAKAGDLVEAVADGVYLIDAESAVELRAATLEWSVAVSGFRLRAGEPPSPLGACRLEGSVPALLSGVRAAARDLAFVPGDGMFGAPTLLVESADAESALRLRPLAVR